MKSPHNQRPDADGARGDRGVHRQARAHSAALPAAGKAGSKQKKDKKAKKKAKAKRSRTGARGPHRPSRSPQRGAPYPRRELRATHDRPGQSPALGIAARDQPSSSPAPRSSSPSAATGCWWRRPRTPRTAIRESPPGDPGRGEDPRVAVRRREPAGARDRPAHPAAERAPAPACRRFRVDVSRVARAAAGRGAVRHRPRARARSRPSVGSAALRHSLSLNVATFHEPAERVLSTQVARMLVEMFFGRIDARTASNEATGELLERFFPGPYELVRPGADVAAPAAGSAAARANPHRSLRRGGAGRPAPVPAGAAPAAARTSTGRPSSGSTAPPTRSPGSASGCASGCALVRPADGEPAGVHRRRGHRLPRLGRGPDARRASPARRSPPARCRSSPTSSSTASSSATASVDCCSRLGDALTLAAQLERLARRRPAAARPAREAAAGRARGASWADVTDEVEASTGAWSRAGTTRPATPRPAPAARAAGDHIHCDLHMHTDHSPDCATPVEVLLETAKAARPRGDRDHRPQRGLGCARGARARRADRRDQGDRRRGGEDRAPGRGDRPLHRGEDRARDVDGGDDRRDPAAGRPRLRAPSVRPAALGARLRAPAGRRRGDRHPRGLQPADRD